MKKVNKFETPFTDSMKTGNVKKYHFLLKDKNVNMIIQKRLTK